jgi:chemotaxis protein MotB
MLKKVQYEQHEEESGEAWLLPYSDLMTLLLAVFIVLFAVSQVDTIKAQGMSDEFSESMMTEKYTQEKMLERLQNESLEESEPDFDQMKVLKAQVDAKLQEQNLSDFVKTEISKRGLVISLSNAVFFDSGKAEVKEEYKTALLAVAEIVTATGHYIRIEGHTDNVPMHSDIFPSNWELSAARAISVVRLFVTETDASPEKFLAAGYGEYRPIADNSTEEGRAQNRRVDIIILNDAYDNMEKEY